jgi:hypothetical protein
LSLEDAEQKAREYLQDKEGATEIKIPEARPQEDHFLVGGWFVDKGGQKYGFELGFGELGALVSKRIGPIARPYFRRARKQRQVTEQMTTDG